ncbi:YlxR family protein [Georgenia soli]|uniref:YlxR family protein n=1 Tax=Georgenia soli TaxID=638953 RepID=UPI000BF60109|nr:YlxR family protein [Georgenia soli]
MSRRSETPTPTGPVRTCIGCRGRAPRSALVRLVLDDTTPRVEVDPERSAPGRGAWLHPSRECLDLALRRRAIGRALRAAGPVGTDAVAAWFDRYVSHRASDAPGDQRVIDEESGLEADGHPMSTQR